MVKIKISRWKSITAITIAVIAVFQGWWFFWGILCLFWAISNILAAETFFVERVEKAENPLIFWIIIIIWLLISAYYFSIDPWINQLILTSLRQP